MSNTKKAYGAMLLAMLFYGVSFPATKAALEVLGPITIVTFRLVISSIFLLIFNEIKYGKEGLPKREDLLFFIVIAVMQPLGYFMTETFGLRLVSASIASILIGTIPVITPIFSRFLLHEKTSLNNYIGLFIAFLGVVLLVVSDFNGGGDASPLGVVLIFCAVFSAVFYTIFVRKLPRHYSPVTVTAVQNTIGLFMFLPFFFIFEFDGTYLFSVLQGDYGFGVLISIAFLAVFSSSFAFIFMNFGIKTLGPSKANGFVNLIPAITAVTSLLFFGEQFTLIKVFGMVIVICGVLLSQYGSFRKQ